MSIETELLEIKKYFEANPRHDDLNNKRLTYPGTVNGLFYYATVTPQGVLVFASTTMPLEDERDWNTSLKELAEYHEDLNYVVFDPWNEDSGWLEQMVNHRVKFGSFKFFIELKKFDSIPNEIKQWMLNVIETAKKLKVWDFE